jgi:hypothetical protein
LERKPLFEGVKLGRDSLFEEVVKTTERLALKETNILVIRLSRPPQGIVQLGCLPSVNDTATNEPYGTGGPGTSATAFYMKKKY